MWRQRCCSYTVRAYNTDGSTRWMGDYFGGATADSDPSIDLKVATIGNVVYVAGPRVESAAAAGTYWNCVRFSRATGAVLGRHDLWVTGHDRDAYSPGDIQDIAAGLDGSIGVLFWHDGTPATNDQKAGRYLATDLSALAVTTFAYHSAGFPFRQIEVDTDSVIHSDGGVGEITREWKRCFALDGTDEFRGGGADDLPDPLVWWNEYPRITRHPGSNLYYVPTAVSPHAVTGNVGAVWQAVPVRFNAPILPGPGTTDTDLIGGMIIDLALMRDSLGAATGIVAIGPHVRGDGGTVVETSGAGALATSGSIADRGNVGRWDLDGTLIKAYSPALTSHVLRVACAQGAGYYLGASRLPTLPTLLACSSADATLWAHRHQVQTDLTALSDGGCVTVGDRSSRKGAGEIDFIT